MLNTRSEPFIVHHVWMIMSSLPIKLWDKVSLEKIRNLVGKIIFFDEKMRDCADKRCARILAKVDISKGLVVKLEINWGTTVFLQPLEYWGLPFRYLVCISIGHLKKECWDIFPTIRNVQGLKSRHLVKKGLVNGDTSNSNASVDHALVDRDCSPNNSLGERMDLRGLVQAKKVIVC